MELQSRESRLVHVAELYYEQGMSQQKIAGLLGLSRPTVSRLLEEARAMGLTDGSRPRDLMTREEGAVMARAAAMVKKS